MQGKTPNPPAQENLASKIGFAAAVVVVGALVAVNPLGGIGLLALLASRDDKKP